MMALTISEVKTDSDLKVWVQFQYDLYAGHEFQVPQLINDELDYFKKSNPAYQVAEVRQFIAKNEKDKVVGRICGIIHSLEEKKLGHKRGRAGWFESIDDQQVANLLFDTCKEWFVKDGCSEMTGPHGFCDLDVEGLLIEGFDFLPTISGSYNFPYYQTLFENYGFIKEVDYHEHRVAIPQQYRLFERMRKKLNDNGDYRYVKISSRKDMMKRSSEVWELLESSFAELYGVTPLSKEQTDYYTKKYFSFLDPKYIILIENRAGKLVGFFIGMPNISKGYKKANGKMLPFGLIKILLNYLRPDTVDFLLAGVDPKDPNGKMLFSMIVLGMYDALIKNKITYLETNRELETNKAVLGIWSRFENVYFRKSRIYKLQL